MSTVTPGTQTTVAEPIPLRERLLAWKEIMETANPPVTRPLDAIGTWLVITRAAVFPMTSGSSRSIKLASQSSSPGSGSRRAIDNAAIHAR